MTDVEARRDLLRSRVGAAFAFVVFGISAASAAWPRPDPVPRPDFTLTGWQPDAARLAPVWAQDAALAKRFPLDDAGRVVLNAVATLGTAETPAAGSMNDPAYAAATDAALDAATAFWFANGKEAYVALGVHARVAFEASVNAVLERARAEKRPVRPWLRNHEGDPDVVRLRAQAGNFVENAVGWGLINDDNTLAGGPDLLRIHFKVRWARLVGDLEDYTFILQPEELRALWRWRVEGDRNLALDQRVKVAGWLKEQIEPDYPVARVLATLHALRGQSDRAIAYYREALLVDPFDAVSSQNLDYLLRARAPEVDEL